MVESWSRLLTSWPCLKVVLLSSTNSPISPKDCYPQVSCLADIFSGCWGFYFYFFSFCSLALCCVQAWLSSRFRRRAPGSIPISFSSVGGADKSGPQVFGPPPLHDLAPLASAPLSSVHPRWSRKNQDSGRQDTCTRTSDKALWLVPGTAIWLFSTFAVFQVQVLTLDNDQLLPFPARNSQALVVFLFWHCLACLCFMSQILIIIISWEGECVLR